LRAERSFEAFAAACQVLDLAGRESFKTQANR
jgi:hypothetical protein